MRFQIPQAPTPLIYPCFRKCQKSSTIVTAKGQQLRETIFRGNASPPHCYHSAAGCWISPIFWQENPCRRQQRKLTRKSRFLKVFEKKCRFYDYDALVLQKCTCYYLFLLFTQKLVASRVTFSTCVWVSHDELQLLEVLDCFRRGNAQEARLEPDENQEEKGNARANSHPWPMSRVFTYLFIFPTN